MTASEGGLNVISSSWRVRSVGSDDARREAVGIDLAPRDGAIKDGADGAIVRELRTQIGNAGFNIRQITA
jgi:hypothetical protein